MVFFNPNILKIKNPEGMIGLQKPKLRVFPSRQMVLKPKIKNPEGVTYL
jgi:hypothetical protein